MSTLKGWYVLASARVVWWKLKILSFSTTLSRHAVNVALLLGLILFLVQNVTITGDTKFSSKSNNIHLLYATADVCLNTYPVSLYVCVFVCVCVCVSWDLELQFLLLLVHVAGRPIWVFRTEPSWSHLPKQTRTLKFPPQSKGEREREREQVLK